MIPPGNKACSFVTADGAVPKTSVSSVTTPTRNGMARANLGI